jgi:hypothetical protein
VTGVLDRRDRRDVELPGDHLPVELGRHADHLLDVEVEPVEDRRHVHVADAPEADHVRRPTMRRGLRPRGGIHFAACH